MFKPLGDNINQKILAVIYILAFQINLASAQNHKLQYIKKVPKEEYQKDQKSEFGLIPLNAPVKESFAKFLLKTPASFDIQQISYRIHNSTDLIEKNKNYSIAKLVVGPKGKELHIPMSNYNNGFYKLYVKVKTKKNGDKEHHYSSAYNNHVKISYDKPLGVVHVPNQKINDSTLLGIDSDNDGVRDDVQIWMNETYNPTAYPSTNNALKQISRHYQLALANYLNQEVAVQYYLKALEGLECIMWVKHSGYQSYKEFKSKYLNTPERIKAFRKVDSYRDGASRPDNISQTNTTERHLFCEFVSTKE